MSKSREYISYHPENPPEWYWINGLHDAGIVGVESFEFPFDYNKFVGEKSHSRKRMRGTALAVEGACVTLGLRELYCNALSLSRLRRQLPPGGSLRTSNLRGMGFARCICKTYAKLAIKGDKKCFSQGKREYRNT